jgi:hypothetical protein
MPDAIDLAQEREEIATKDAIRRNSSDIEPGKPGDCDLCGEWCGRLIRGTCARCRDKYKLA